VSDSSSDPVFNPLDKLELGKSVVAAILARPPVRLSEVSKFKGGGLYALYYGGAHKTYQPYLPLNRPPDQFKAPIYVGRAEPAGKRKGLTTEASLAGTSLFDRLSRHRDCVNQVSLSATDFWTRWLVVDDIWIPLGERLLIEHFKPLWNITLDGFGNNDPGRGRYNGARPDWDELHSGRPWAAKCAPAKRTVADIELRIAEHLKKHLGQIPEVR
jgi:hypothetical protein